MSTKFRWDANFHPNYLRILYTPEERTQIEQEGEKMTLTKHHKTHMWYH